MYQRRTLALSDDERAELLYHRDHDPKPYVRERCAALLKIADGHSPYAVAHAGLLRHRDPDTVYAWLAAVFLDEMGFSRWPDPAPNWAGAPPVADRRGANNGLWRLIGGLNAWTGQVNYLDAYIVGRAKVTEFYGQLVEAYPEARRLYVIQDNWSIHTHPDVLGALEQWPQVEPVWLPTYAPWLNPIEKLWRWLRQDVLKMHRLAEDWIAVRGRVREFLEQFAHGSQRLLEYVGLLGSGRIAQMLRGP